MATFGSRVPERVVRRWEPLQIYYDRANVVIAPQKDAHEERGFYVVPLGSSAGPATFEPGWSWEPVRFSYPDAGYRGSLYEYSRKR